MINKDLLSILCDACFVDREYENAEKRWLFISLQKVEVYWRN